MNARHSTDEARAPTGRAGAHAKPWAVGDRQFELVRAVDGKRYLIRWWVLKTPWGGIALHRMDAPDVRSTLHDHPFAFVSVVLRGGYVEKRLDPQTMGTYLRTIRRVNVMRCGDAHTITRLLRVPTWTLLFVGRHRRTWGFWEHGADVFVPGIVYRRSWLWTQHDHFDSGHYVP